MMRMEIQTLPQQDNTAPPPRPPPRVSSRGSLSPQKASSAAAPSPPWRPAAAVLHADCLFLRPSSSSSGAGSSSDGSTSKEARLMEAVAVLPRFGTEQLLQYLEAQEPPVAVTVAAPSASSRALLATARADPTQAPLLEGVCVVPPLSSQLDEAGRGGGSGNNEDDAHGSPEALLAFVGRASTTAGASSSNGGGMGATGPVLVIAPAHAPSPAPEQDEQLQKQQHGQMPRFVAAVLPEPGAAGQDMNNKDGVGLATPSNGHAAGAQAAAWPPRQDVAGCVATGVEWARLGLPPLVVDVQNPPFLWPRDYERREAAARLVEARWWDPSHGQLNLVLGRGVHAGNALEVVTAETHRADGTLALAGLESVFVTVRHEFGLMARLLADGYRIHHAAGGGTQVVLLRRFVKVEVPTAGTHIVRSKVILFRRRSRLLATAKGVNGAKADSGNGGGGGGMVRGRPTGSGLSPLASPGAEHQPEALAVSVGDSSPGKALLGMRRRSRSVGSQAEAAGWEEGDEEDVEIFMFRRRAKGIWKMPGGHVEMKELADEAAVRELREETGYACKVLGMVALTERKDVGKKWGCSQLMFTFAAEWRESEMRLDDATSREGRWFPLGEMDALVAKDSAALDPPLKKVWPSFRARDKWFTHHAECVDPGYELRKRYYMAAPAHPQASPDTVADTATAADGVQQLAVMDDGNGLAVGAAPQGGGRPSGRNDPSSLSSLRRLSLSESYVSSIGCSSSDWSRS